MIAVKQEDKQKQPATSASAGGPQAVKVSRRLVLQLACVLA
jgi:hypothetical protein